MPSECNPRSTASQVCAVLRCKPEWSTARWRNIAVTMAYSAPDDPCARLGVWRATAHTDVARRGTHAHQHTTDNTRPPNKRTDTATNSTLCIAADLGFLHVGRSAWAGRTKRVGLKERRRYRCNGHSNGIKIAAEAPMLCVS